MSVAAVIEAKLEACPGAKRIVLDPRNLAELKREVMPWRVACGEPWLDGGSYTTFWGVPIHTEMPREFCRNCGAPIEPNECSYCKTSSTIITVE